MDNFRPWLKHYDPGVTSKLKYPDYPLPVILENAAIKSPEATCAVFNGKHHSFEGINDDSTTLAKNLVTYGVKVGDRIGLILDNSPLFLITFFGILKAGGVVVAINPKFKESEIQFQIKVADMSGVISDKRFLKKLKDLSVEKSLRFFIIFENDADFVKGQLFRVTDKWAKIESTHNTENHQVLEEVKLPTIRGDNPAIYQFSGGTTGIPKAAIGLHRNLVANVTQFSCWLTALNKKEKIFLSVIPFYHVYGMVLGMCLPIFMGTTQILQDNPQDINQLITTIKSHQPSIFPAVPNMFSALLSSPRVNELRQCSLKTCISGSAPLITSVKEKFESLTGARILEGYGLSEAPTATHCNPLLGINKEGSIGLPLPDVDCRIIDLERGTSEISPGVQGELILQGPQVMLGYANNMPETKNAIRKGWLYTGDIARMDEDGYFYITGRKKDLIKVGGFQVWPGEIEEVIRKFPGINDVVVAGVKDDKAGERTKAWVILEIGYSLDVWRLRKHCRKFLANYKVPREFDIVEEFPRSSIGKVLRRELIRLDEEKKSPGN
jgi:long-chain acyl-CoA synthetase